MSVRAANTTCPSGRLLVPRRDPWHSVPLIQRQRVGWTVQRLNAQNGHPDGRADASVSVKSPLDQRAQAFGRGAQIGIRGLLTLTPGRSSDYILTVRGWPAGGPTH